MKDRAPTPLQILIVEDNATNRVHLERLFSHLGCSSMAAVNGQEALEVLSTHSFQLVAMDLHMPVMDGWTATRHIRSMNILQPKITAVTADTYPETAQKCHDAGMDYFLPKPVNIAAMKQCLRALFPTLDLPGSRPPRPTPAPESSISCLNVSHLEGLVARDAPDHGCREIADLWEMTRGDFAGRFLRLRQICLSQDEAAFCEIVHGLKGCALTAGAQVVAKCLSQALAEARQRQFTDWVAFPGHLERLFSATDLAMQDYLRQLSQKSL